LATEREKILQAAQRYVDRRRYDRAIVELQKLVDQDPSDARTLLKIGDLQARLEQYPEAIETYDQVGQYYAAQGFALKAIAVYKQIRELIRKHAPELADRFGYILPKLAEIYTQLELTTDALAAYDEYATRLQKAARDQDAIQVFRKMVDLDASNPLPHLRLAEACCRVQALDEAIESFWTAAELLLSMKRSDDALKVVERILHFRQDPRFARVAAELYLQRGTREDGLQALAKLQICFQSDPRNIDTLALLAQAFTVIGQEGKAVEVYKEMARIARDQHLDDLYGQLLAHLRGIAPNDEQVRGMPSVPPRADDRPEPRKPSAPQHSAEALSDDALESIPPSDFEALVPDRQALAPPRAIQASAPDVMVLDDDFHPVEASSEPVPADVDALVRKAVVDAESFRRLRLYTKAVEALHIALELDAGSFEARQRLRDVLVEAGDREGASLETVNLARMCLDQGDVQQGEAFLYEALELSPHNADAHALLGELVPASPDAYGAVDDGATVVADPTRHAAMMRSASQPPPGVYREHEPLPSYDLEEVSAAQAIPSEPEVVLPSLDEMDAPFGTPGEVIAEAPLPSFPLGADGDDLMAGLDGTDAPEAVAAPSLDDVDDLSEFVEEEASGGGGEALEEALEEADFFVSRGLYDDARAILLEQLARMPNHPLLIERMREVQEAAASAGESRTIDRSTLGTMAAAPAGYANKALDVAASLHALDDLEPPAASISAEALSRVENENDVEQVFQKFQGSVRAQVAENDAETHYELGLAYKDMQLFGDAIHEFLLASRNPHRECMSFAMIGLIHLEQGDLGKAAEAYVRALNAPERTPEQELNLYYELGSLHARKGSTNDALYYFQKIAKQNSSYRDVRIRIAQIQATSIPPPPPTSRAVNDHDDFDQVFDDLFDSK
jgi:tetratricopeptide (TPR) repeat protein